MKFIYKVNIYECEKDLDCIIKETKKFITRNEANDFITKFHVNKEGIMPNLNEIFKLKKFALPANYEY